MKSTSVNKNMTKLQRLWMTGGLGFVAVASQTHLCKKGSPYSITERRVPELIPVLGCQRPAGDVSHKPSSRLPLLAARPACLATLTRAATSFAAW